MLLVFVNSILWTWSQNTSERAAALTSNGRGISKGCSLGRDIETRHSWSCMEVIINLCWMKADNNEGLGFDDLSRPNMKMNTIWEPLRKKRHFWKFYWIQTLALRLWNYIDRLSKKHMAKWIKTLLKTYLISWQVCV